MITGGVLDFAELPGHVLHAAERAISERVAVGVFVAKSNRVPPVRRPHFRKAIRPDTGVPADDIFNQPVTIRVGGEHFVGPAFNSCIVGGQPLIAVSTTHTIICRNQQ